jgi:outer membrane protein assembly factor BamA
MACRIYLRFGILALFGTLCSSRLLYAQYQGCVDTAVPSRVPVQKTKITIVGLEFNGENPLSDVLRAQLAEKIQHSELWSTAEQPDSSWVNEALEPIREVLRSHGHFKTNVNATPYLTLALATERRYALSVAIDAGPQYWLGSLRFASASGAPLSFAEAELRVRTRLQEGELFDVEKIREGLGAISKLYGSKGYIDATPEPDTTIHEKDSRIDLLIKVDEQKRYRIAKIEFLGLPTAVQKSLTAVQEIGDPLNMVLWRNFFEANRTHLSADASPDKNMRVRRDVSNATVDITMDFRPCPKTQPSD